MSYTPISPALSPKKSFLSEALYCFSEGIDGLQDDHKIKILREPL